MRRVVREFGPSSQEARPQTAAVGTALEGPWYLTRTAVSQYAQIFLGGTGPNELGEARQDLVEVCRSAHRMKEIRPGVWSWRASSRWYRALLLVADPGAPGFVSARGERQVRWTLPALVAVRPPFKGWKLGGNEP